jgi:hypothetical protein
MFDDLTDSVKAIEHYYPEVSFHSFGGVVPVQAFGTFGNKFFYFRFRHNAASLTIGDTRDGDYVPEGETFYLEDVTDESMSGFLTPEEFKTVFSELAKKAISWMTEGH